MMRNHRTTISLVISTLLLLAANARCADWSLIDVPGLQPAARQSTRWLRAYVRVPHAWAQPNGLLADSVTLIVDRAVDACRVQINGTVIGDCGSFPPQYLSAREETNRLKVPPGLLRPGQYN
ncbi:MAG: hypothetical protein KDA92_01660, partial [Planctomycetales bacterium]|nr:hypothetical protein [Planctomycetales bacterium]